MTNVKYLPPSENYTVEQALNNSLSCNLKEVLIIGYDNDDDLFVRSSKMNRKDALWLLQSAIFYTME
jgi:hypothetical protein